MGHSGPLLALTPPTHYKSPSLTTPPTTRHLPLCLSYCVLEAHLLLVNICFYKVFKKIHYSD